MKNSTHSFSLIRETKEAIKRFKDTSPKDEWHTIAMPGLNEDQARAVGAIIGLAQGRAMLKMVKQNSVSDTLDEISRAQIYASKVTPGNPVTLSFPAPNNTPVWVYEAEELVPQVLSL